MANRNQHCGGQHAQDRDPNSSRDQMGSPGHGSQGQQSAYQGSNQGQLGSNYGHDTNYQGTQEYGNYSLSRDAGYNPRETNANDQWEPENSRGPRGYGHSQSYGGAMSHVDDIQRGSNSWQQHSDRFQRTNTPGGYNQSLGGNDQGGYQGSFGNVEGTHHDTDYHQWRTEQIRSLDNDYKAWRDERYTNFSKEFVEWRNGRKNKQSPSASSTGSHNGGDFDSPSTTGNPSNVSVNTAPKNK